MKKILAVLTVVMLAAFAAPAFAATNPFMDVPASHWAYDAVGQLAARGVISGYPDGTFKGPQPATRYEIASIIARSLSYLDLDKASKQDVEMMRRLIVEFSDELSALGVTLDDVDSRLAVLENDLGGWKLSGVFEFNAKFSEDRTGGEADWDLDKYRIFLDKRINETTTFRARIGKDGGVGANGHANAEAGVTWDQYYITTKLPYDIEVTAGRFVTDWEGEQGLYTDDDAWMNDIARQGFRVRKDFGVANFALLLQRHNDNDDEKAIGRGEYYRVALNANLNFHEKLGAGVLGYADISDSGDGDRTTVGGYVKLNFHPSIALKGLYYYQEIEVPGRNDLEINAWKAILDINQDLLKFTSLWVEYAQVEEDFVFDTGSTLSTYAGYAFEKGPDDNRRTGIGDNIKFILAKASQQWNDKWDSWLRYSWADYDNGGEEFNQIGAGIGYQLNPAVHFELAYDYAEYNNGTDDNLIRFQTVVNF